ncbi:hypothetical protein K439DRAFT_1618119 [Ramaria rubella]|nr:hypothetical protein K439DRAFT_1618119 [Ramaria rubella]
MCGLACNPDVPLPLNGLVSLFLLEAHTYVPGTMDDLISVTCRLAQNFASQGWATKEGTSKSQILLQDVLGVMYGSVDMFSWRTIAWEPVPLAKKPPLHTTAPGCDIHGPDVVRMWDGSSPSLPPIEGLRGARPVIKGAPPSAILPGHRIARGHQRVREVGHVPELGESPARGVVCGAVSQRLGPKARSHVHAHGGATASLHDPTCARRASGTDARISGVLPLFQAAGFPTRAGLAADPGIQVRGSRQLILLWESADPNPPRRPLAHRTLPRVWGARQCRPGPPLAHQPPGGGTVLLPPPAPTGPSSAGCPAHDAAPLWLPAGWPNVRILDVPDPLLSSPAPTPRLHPTRGQTCVIELPPPRHARSPLPVHHLSKRARSASRCPPGEDVQAVCSSEPHPIAGGRPTPPFNTFDSALLHVIQRAACSGGLSPGERKCVVAHLRGMPAPPQGFLGVVAHLRSLMDQTSLAPWDFNPQGDGVLPWLLPWARVLISWVCKDMHVAPGSDHRGVIVNMYLELSRTEWWALSDWREVLSEWCKGASMPV